MRDDFTKRTVTEIAKGVGYRCSNPECRRPTVGANAEQDGTIIIGVAAHICAASPGGPRYNAAQTPEARRSKENGLWLCQNCGRLVDADPKQFTVEQLTGWKREAQTRAFRDLVAFGPALAEEPARVEASITADDRPVDAEFDAVFQKIHAAATADLGTYTRGPMWSGDSIELTLRIDGDKNSPSFSIGKLPLAVEVAPEVTIVAPPGTGKTTTLLQLASHALTSNSILPLYFRLGDWSAGSTGLLASLYQRSAFKAISTGEISALAERGRLLLLLDGWNELTPEAHKRLRVEVGQIRRDWPDVRIVATTRRQALDVPISGPRVHIEPLSEDQQMAIADEFYGAPGKKIVDDAWRTPGVRALIATPLYLSALLAGGSQGVVSDTKEAVLRLLVEQHERAVEHVEVLQSVLLGCHAELLTELASHLNALGSTTMTEADARRIVTTTAVTLREQGQIARPLEPISVLEALTSHHTLIRSGDGVAFQHQQFQEWYGSHKVSELIRLSAGGDTSARVQLRAAIFDQPMWEESVLFATERLSRESNGAELVAHAIRLALPIDPMLAAEIIYRAAPVVWKIVTVDIAAFVERWHRPGAVDRAVRFMIITGRPEFAQQIWPLASSSDTQIQIPTLRIAPRFRPRVLGHGLPEKIAKLPEDTREHLLSLIASESGVDGMDLAVELAKADPSPKIQSEVVQSLQFRRADRHVADLLSHSHERTWELIAARGYADEIRDLAVASKLRALRLEALEQATEPSQRLRLLLEQPTDYLGRDAAIAATIADPRFPIRDQQGGTLYFAQQHAPNAVSLGLRRRLEAGLELPFRVNELLAKQEVIDEGPIAKAILDVSHEKRDINVAAIMAGPKTVDALIDMFLKCAQALQATRNDRSLSDEYHRIKDRIRGTRPAIFAAAIARRADSDDPRVIGSLASLLSQHGTEDEDRKRPLAIDPVTKPAWIGLLRRWTEAVITASAGRRYDINEVSNAIGRLGFRELIPELKRLLDEDLSRLKRAREAFMDAQKRGDINATSDARMRYDNQYREAFMRIGGDDVAVVAAQYLEDSDFGVSASLILKSVSDKELNFPAPDLFRQWPWFDDVAAARNNRAASPQPEPLNKRAVPIFTAIERLARPEADKDIQMLAIALARIALSMPHADHDSLIVRVMNLPQPLAAKQTLLAAMVLDGQIVDSDLIMRAIDEWLADANDPQKAWHKRQNAWEIEPWLELLPFSTRPESLLEGLTKVKAFYGSGWAKRWERVLGAVAAVPGTQGNTLLESLARAHRDIAHDYTWMQAILNRGNIESVLLYVDLFIERVLGTEPHGVDAWHVGRQLAGFVERFPELKPELKKRYETVGNGPGRRMLEHFFGEAASYDDLIAMVRKYAASGQAYDGQMASVIEAVALDKVPDAEGSNLYHIYPAPVRDLRKALFDLLSASAAEAALAKKCLEAIDELRDEHGIAADDTRHPDVLSGRPWPPEAAPT
ncbi:hypothetical protein SAMN05443247_00459 [Bradyrhizobium erythrophlei]|nr:hypothetical protein SAMN05443247_00459 [Bradyrhizobium erythrophlei]